MAKIKNGTTVVTNPVRLSYANVWEPKSINGSEPKYSVSLLIPKTDKETINAIQTAIDNAIQGGIGTYGGKIPPKGALKLPLRDGDTERDDEVYKGCYFINANSKTQPQIVDAAVAPVLDRSEVYSGCWARVSINLYPFSASGNKGVACGLGNIQKVRDDNRLGGGSNASEDFDEFDDMGL
jgi:hypothetical protein